MNTKSIKSQLVKITSQEEPVTIIRLEDGSTIHIRLIVFAVHAIFDENGLRQFNPDGSPIYGINSQQVMYIEKFESVPEGIKRS